jgi:hypothetical protein
VGSTCATEGGKLSRDRKSRRIEGEGLGAGRPAGRLQARVECAVHRRATKSLYGSNNPVPGSHYLRPKTAQRVSGTLSLSVARLKTTPCPMHSEVLRGVSCGASKSTIHPLSPATASPVQDAAVRLGRGPIYPSAQRSGSHGAALTTSRRGPTTSLHSAHSTLVMQMRASVPQAESQNERASAECDGRSRGGAHPECSS